MRRISLRRDRDAAPPRDARDLGLDFVDRGIADRVVAGADIERQFAAPGDDVDRPVRHRELTDGADQPGEPARSAAPPQARSRRRPRRHRGALPSARCRRVPPCRSWRSLARTPPAIAVTMPTGSPACSRTGPCSMCTSRYPEQIVSARASAADRARIEAGLPHQLDQAAKPSASRRSSIAGSKRPATALLPMNSFEKTGRPLLPRRRSARDDTAVSARRALQLLHHDQRDENPEPPVISCRHCARYRNASQRSASSRLAYRPPHSGPPRWRRRRSATAMPGLPHPIAQFSGDGTVSRRSGTCRSARRKFPTTAPAGPPAP